VRFYQAAASAAQVHAIEAAEVEKALVLDIDGAVHDSSCVAGSLDESSRVGPPQVAATVTSKTAGGGGLFRAEAAIYFRGKAE
jgi:hypothetical protein